jgi:hypothetical protein
MAAPKWPRRDVAVRPLMRWPPLEGLKNVRPDWNVWRVCSGPLRFIAPDRRNQFLAAEPKARRLIKGTQCGRRANCWRPVRVCGCLKPWARARTEPAFSISPGRRGALEGGSPLPAADDECPLQAWALSAYRQNLNAPLGDTLRAAN